MKNLILFPLLLACSCMGRSSAEPHVKAEVDNNVKPVAAVTTEKPHYKFSSPYSHKNLQIFLILGNDNISDEKYLTLTEALEKKIVIVHETSNVQQLSIENTHKTLPVYINSGDIVKGGRQDRVIRYDVIVPPNSGKMPIGSFCVEQGRWAGRGNENVKSFSANSAILSSRGQKLAARYNTSQSDVWQGVSASQGKLNKSLRQLKGKESIDVRSGVSASSLQLTLEDKELKSLADHYMKVLKPIIEQHTEAIGFAYTINGEINTIEVYGQHALFAALWEKLLHSAVVESIAEFKDPKEVKKWAGPVELDAFIKALEKGKETRKDINKRTIQVTRESKEGLFFESRDSARDFNWLHRTYIKASEKERKKSGPATNTNFRNNAPRQEVQQRR